VRSTQPEQDHNGSVHVGNERTPVQRWIGSERTEHCSISGAPDSCLLPEHLIPPFKGWLRENGARPRGATRSTRATSRKSWLSPRLLHDARPSPCVPESGVSSACYFQLIMRSPLGTNRRRSSAGRARPRAGGRADWTASYFQLITAVPSIGDVQPATAGGASTRVKFGMAMGLVYFQSMGLPLSGRSHTRCRVHVKRIGK
jgi:hypothetical protein